MKACNQFDSLLSAFLEDETSLTEAKFVRTHLTACARCRHQRDEMEALLHQVRNLPRVQTEDGFTKRVLARTQGLEAAGLDAPAMVTLIPRRPAWAAPLAAAAVLSVIIFGVAKIPRGSISIPETVQLQPVDRSPELDLVPVSGTVEDLEETGLETPRPEVSSLGNQENKGQSLGMVQDVYVVDAYELREPTVGGQPILTRVSETDTPITVTF